MKQIQNCNLQIHMYDVMRARTRNFVKELKNFEIGPDKTTLKLFDYLKSLLLKSYEISSVFGPTINVYCNNKLR